MTHGEGVLKQRHENMNRELIYSLFLAFIIIILPCLL